MLIHILHFLVSDIHSIHTQENASKLLSDSKNANIEYMGVGRKLAIHKLLGKITVGLKGMKGQARNARRTNGFVTGVRAALVLSDARAAA